MMHKPKAMEPIEVAEAEVAEADAPANTSTHTNTNTTRITNAKTEEQVTFHVEGMTCGACASRISAAIETVDGVSEACVNFAWSKATILHNGNVDITDLRSVVDQMGYTTKLLASSKQLPKPGHKKDDATTSLNVVKLRRKFILAAVASMPVVAVSMLPSLRFTGWRWFALFAATFVVFTTGWHFHKTAIRNLRHRFVTMDTLISIATISAWIWSTVVLATDLLNSEIASGNHLASKIASETTKEIANNHLYFETAMVIITFVLLGKWMESRSTYQSTEALKSLASLTSSTARLTDGSELPADQLTVGMRFIVRPGERIATDGVVIDGVCAVDASMITGEPAPVAVSAGDHVTGATINTDGVIEVEATRVGADTVLAQIVRLVEEAQSGRASVQRLADRVSAIFVPCVIVVAAVTFAAWMVVGTSDDAFTAAVAVLIISCPCALGLATPLAVMVGTLRAAQLGVIIKGAETFERVRAVDTVLIDKTGTLTVSRLEVAHTAKPEHAQVINTNTNATTNTTGPREQPTELASVFTLAAALESLSEHPVGAAIARHWPSKLASELQVEGFKNHPGIGVAGWVNNTEVRVGKRSMFNDVPVLVEAAAEEAEAIGCTTVLAGRGATAEAVISLTDKIKPTSVDAVRRLREMGLHVTLLTGDNARTAQAVGKTVAADDVIAEVLPSEKAAIVNSLRKEGKSVAMIGDGINDAPALAQADMGIAMSTGADVTIEASDVTIMGGDLLAVVDALVLARRILSTIKTNLIWAFAYNIAAIPLAVAAVLSPMPAAAAMSLSSLFVVSNSLRLYRFRSYRS